MTSADITTLNQYIQRVMQTSPAPPVGSNVYTTLEGLLQITATASQIVANSGVWTAQLQTQLEQVAAQAKLADEQWQQESGRSLTPVPAAVAGGGGGCGLLNPWECFTAVLGPVLGWVAFGAVAYYGGRWAYNKWIKPTRADAARKRRGTKYPRYATR